MAAHPFRSDPPGIPGLSAHPLLGLVFAFAVRRSDARYLSFFLNRWEPPYEESTDAEDTRGLTRRQRYVDRGELASSLSVGRTNLAEYLAVPIEAGLDSAAYCRPQPTSDLEGRAFSLRGKGDDLGSYSQT